MTSYKPSGKMGPLLLPAALVGGLVLALGGAWIYQWGVRIIPFVYVNFLVTMGYGFVIGYVVVFLFHLLKGRNTHVAVGLAVLIAVVGWGASFYFGYGHWRIDVVEDLALLDIPIERVDLGFASYIDAVVESGWIIGVPPDVSIDLTGVFVYIIWLIEGGLIIGSAAKAAFAVSNEPFCETCGVWMPGERIAYLEKIELRAAKAASKNRSLDDLFEVAPAKGRSASALIEGHRCAGVHCPQWVTARITWAGQDDDDGKLVCRHRRASHAEIDEIVAIGKERTRIRMGW